MNKKFLTVLLVTPFILSACSLEDLHNRFPHIFPGDDDFVPSHDVDPHEEEDDPTPPEPEFHISSARFIDEQGHLRVDYYCTVGNPFFYDKHPFGKLNIMGVTASEIDSSPAGYFTVLSPIIDTSLKFEFYDINNVVYFTERYTNIIPYSPDTPIEPGIDYPTGYTQLYWSDEFEGNSLNTSNWTYEIGTGYNGWGNGEAQYYTNSNDTVSDGYLTIQARKEQMYNSAYTSTRIKTQNKVRFTYGYVEAKIALPAGTGMWPAFWMMPDASVYGGWPHSGEIDIMEARGRLTTISSSALHFSTLQGQHTYLTEEKHGHDITQFHKYAVEWKRDSIAYYVDDVCFYTIYKYQWTTSGNKDSETAPFDQNFYIILNLAVGGQFDGYQNPPASFVSADMKIDYVRVFK